VTTHEYSIATDPALAESVSKTKEDDDYVWDLFYHKPGTVSDWTQTATVGTMLVTFQFSAPQSLTILAYTEQDFLHLGPRKIPILMRTLKLRMKQTKTQIVSKSYVYHCVLICSTCSAEGYYKNDYPDEESESDSEHSGRFIFFRCFYLMLKYCQTLSTTGLITMKSFTTLKMVPTTSGGDSGHSIEAISGWVCKAKKGSIK